MYTIQLHIPFHSLLSKLTITQYPSNAHFHRQLTKSQICANSAASKLPLFHMCYLRFPNSVILTDVSDKSCFYSILHNKVIFRKACGLVIAELTIFFIINAFRLYILPDKCDYFLKCTAHFYHLWPNLHFFFYGYFFGILSKN